MYGYIWRIKKLEKKSDKSTVSKKSEFSAWLIQIFFQGVTEKKHGHSCIFSDM